MPTGHGAPERATPRWTPRDWRRYWTYQKRAAIRRRVFKSMFQEHGDLYGRQWELAEVEFIREECDEVGLPMGYGRVGREPVQLTWGTATAPNPRVDWDGFKDGVESEDEEA